MTTTPRCTNSDAHTRTHSTQHKKQHKTTRKNTNKTKKTHNTHTQKTKNKQKQTHTKHKNTHKQRHTHTYNTPHTHTHTNTTTHTHTPHTTHHTHTHTHTHTHSLLAFPACPTYITPDHCYFRKHTRSRIWYLSKGRYEVKISYTISSYSIPQNYVLVTRLLINNNKQFIIIKPFLCVTFLQ